MGFGLSGVYLQVYDFAFKVALVRHDAGRGVRGCSTETALVYRLVIHFDYTS